MNGLWPLKRGPPYKRSAARRDSIGASTEFFVVTRESMVSSETIDLTVTPKNKCEIPHRKAALRTRRICVEAQSADQTSTG